MSYDGGHVRAVDVELSTREGLRRVVPVSLGDLDVARLDVVERCHREGFAWLDDGLDWRAVQVVVRWGLRLDHPVGAWFQVARADLAVSPCRAESRDHAAAAVLYDKLGTSERLGRVIPVNLRDLDVALLDAV